MYDFLMELGYGALKGAGAALCACLFHALVFRPLRTHSPSTQRRHVSYTMALIVFLGACAAVISSQWNVVVGVLLGVAPFLYAGARDFRFLLEEEELNRNHGLSKVT